MSLNVLRILHNVSLGLITVALLVLILLLVRVLSGWRGPQRKRRLVQLGIGMGMFLSLSVAHFGLIWGLMLPAMGRESNRINAELRRERNESNSLVSVGESAPSFSVTDTEGRRFDLQEQRGKVVLINFFATWCGPCMEELPHLQKMTDELRANQDFVLIVIGREETPEKVADFRRKREYRFRMAADEDRSVFAKYAKESIPRNYLISRTGKIVFASAGMYEEELVKLRNEIDRQLSAAE